MYILIEIKETGTYGNSFRQKMFKMTPSKVVTLKATLYFLEHVEGFLVLKINYASFLPTLTVLRIKTK